LNRLDLTGDEIEIRVLLVAVSREAIIPEDLLDGGGDASSRSSCIRCIGELGIDEGDIILIGDANGDELMCKNEVAISSRALEFLDGEIRPGVGSGSVARECVDRGVFATGPCDDRLRYARGGVLRGEDTGAFRLSSSASVTIASGSASDGDEISAEFGDVTSDAAFADEIIFDSESSASTASSGAESTR
jgi:hypothetical protein